MVTRRDTAPLSPFSASSNFHLKSSLGPEVAYRVTKVSELQWRRWTELLSTGVLAFKSLIGWSCQIPSSAEPNCEVVVGDDDVAVLVATRLIRQGEFFFIAEEEEEEEEERDGDEDEEQ